MFPLVLLDVIQRCIHQVNDPTLQVKVISHLLKVWVHFQHCCLQIPTNPGHLLRYGIPLWLEVVEVVDDPGNRCPNCLQHLVILMLPGACLRRKINPLHKPRIYNVGITSTFPRMILCWRCDLNTVANHMAWIPADIWLSGSTQLGQPINIRWSTIGSIHWSTLWFLHSSKVQMV